MILGARSLDKHGSRVPCVQINVSGFSIPDGTRSMVNVNDVYVSADLRMMALVRQSHFPMVLFPGW